MKTAVGGSVKRKRVGKNQVRRVSCEERRPTTMKNYGSYEMVEYACYARACICEPSVNHLERDKL